MIFAALYICMYVCIYVSMNLCMMYVCMYVYTHLSINLYSYMIIRIKSWIFIIYIIALFYSENARYK